MQEVSVTTEEPLLLHIKARGGDEPTRHLSASLLSPRKHLQDDQAALLASHRPLGR